MQLDLLHTTLEIHTGKDFNPKANYPNLLDEDLQDLQKRLQDFPRQSATVLGGSFPSQQKSILLPVIILSIWPWKIGSFQQLFMYLKGGCLFSWLNKAMFSRFVITLTDSHLDSFQLVHIFL